MGLFLGKQAQNDLQKIKYLHLMTSPLHAPVPTLSLKEKLIIIGKALLLGLVIYTVIDLYVPLKRLLSGDGITFAEALSYIETHKKLHIIALITFFMARSSIKKRNKALQEAQVSLVEPAEGATTDK
ncbi:hypothetical protein [Rufibacter latericius]|uniref:Uncharacterized protein n=1 Tax=Rufibacter latericius TaxID=2487040 RepID=A0A3M9MKX8_9BACT|nr:hypothetical protein [Rufibacter latericius]RNI26200.1 hypothetical protein EFB08_15425 [Rufibacter latericius]